MSATPTAAGLDPISENRAGTDAAYLGDGHSGVRQAIDAGGAILLLVQRFDAYGQIVLQKQGSLQTPIGYRGERFDATLGQYYLRARYYDPASGRFTGVDPFVGTYGDPQQIMRYGYAGSNPISYSDPTGQFAGVTVGFGLSLSLHVPTLVKGGLISTALLTFGQAGTTLRGEGLQLIAEGEIEAGLLLYEMGGQVFGSGATLAQTASDAIDTFQIALLGIQIIRGLSGIAQNGSLSRISTSIRGLMRSGRSVVANAVGRGGGTIMQTDEVAQMQTWLNTMNHVDPNTGKTIIHTIDSTGSTLPAGGGGRHNARLHSDGSVTSTIYVHSNATFYEMAHEVEHALHLTRIGYAKYDSLSKAQREYAVYRAMRNNPQWNTWTKAEQDNAFDQIMLYNGPEAPPSGYE